MSDEKETVYTTRERRMAATVAAGDSMRSGLMFHYQEPETQFGSLDP